MEMLLRVLVLLHLVIFKSADFIDRPYASASKNYFGSKIVWDGFCEQKDKFIAMFQLMDDRVSLKGTPEQLAITLQNNTEGRMICMK